MRDYQSVLRWHLTLAVVVALLCSGLVEAEQTLPPARVVTFDRAEWTVPPQRRAEGVNHQRLEREGLVVDFSARPLNRSRAEIHAEDLVELTLAVRDQDNAPLRGVYPAVWVDYDKTPHGGASGMSCKDRVGMYLAGNVGIRPMVDLNSYYILVMNKGPTISVIDPIIGVTGRTKLYTQINLEQPGGDWVGTEDGKRLYVSMPDAGKVAVVDTETFRVIATPEVGAHPLRTALQPDEAYLWIGNNGADGSSGVTVLDTRRMAPVKQLATGAGHHEIAFNRDGDRAFISNREGGSVTVIDTRTLEPVKTLVLGGKPLALGYSALADLLYVVDAERGKVFVVDQQLQLSQAIELTPGLGPLGVSPDGRWVIFTEPFADRVSIVDTATNQIVHQVKIPGRPYQVEFSRAFAYIRALESEKVSMLELQHFERSTLPVVGFPAGASPPGAVTAPSIASQMVEAPGEAAMVVVSPGDATVYYYMEGMNAPMGNFRNYGQIPRAVTVVDRTLREEQPGLYQAHLKLPVAGTYQVAMVLESPQLLHCFDLQVLAPEAGAPERDTLAVTYLDAERVVKAGRPMSLRFRLQGEMSGRPRDDLSRVEVLYYRAPGAQRRVVSAEHRGDGVYQVELELARRGAYFIHVGVPEAELGFEDLPRRTLVAR